MVNGTTFTLSYIFQFLFFSLMHTRRTWPSWMSTSGSRGNSMARDSSFSGGCGPKGLKWLRSHHPQTILCCCYYLWLFNYANLHKEQCFFFFFFSFFKCGHITKHNGVCEWCFHLLWGFYTSCNSFKLLSSGNFKVRLDLDWALWGVSQW